MKVLTRDALHLLADFIVHGFAASRIAVVRTRAFISREHRADGNSCLNTHYFVSCLNSECLAVRQQRTTYDRRPLVPIVEQVSVGWIRSTSTASFRTSSDCHDHTWRLSTMFPSVKESNLRLGGKNNNLALLLGTLNPPQRLLVVQIWQTFEVEVSKTMGILPLPSTNVEGRQ